jgi:type IV pilus assembly protein PilW
MKTLRKRPSLRIDAGFSLIEMMVAMTVSLVIMVALAALFVNLSRSNAEMAKTNSQIDNGRFAIQLLETDIVHAGFWGSYVPQFDDLSFATVPADAPNAVPDPCLAYTAPNWTDQYKNNLLGIPLQAYEIDSPVPTPALPVCADVVQSPKANTDVLVVRHAATCLPGIRNCEAIATGKLYFQPSLCENEISAGLRYVLDTANFTLKARGCTGTPPAATVGTAAPMRKFMSAIYYVRNYAVTAGDGIPTLMRAQFDLDSGTVQHQTAEPVVEGIESIRVELGIDNRSSAGSMVNYAQAIAWVDPDTKKAVTNRGDGVADEYVRCSAATPCDVGKLANVVAVKLYVLARSRDTTPGYTDEKTYRLGGSTLGPFNDHYQRHVFATTIRLASVSGRRETPN